MDGLKIRYIIHDTTNGGTDNGISRSAISNFTEQVAEELGLDYQDYNLYDIVHELNNDPELMELAQEIYTPYPIDNSWTDAYKAYYQKAIDERTAPGVAEIPDELVYRKIHPLLKQLADEILPPCRAKAAADAEERERIMSKVKEIKTTENSIEDEGGQTVEYFHVVTLKNGATYSFNDRNLFDVGRVINPAYQIAEGVRPGGICSLQDNGEYVWKTFVGGKEGWSVVRPLTEDETYGFLAVANYCGHCNSEMRI